MAAQAPRPCGELAYGDVKRVELAMALAHAPRLLLMDEPTAGMATRERHALMRLTRELTDTRGIAVLFTEHSLDVVFQHADRIVVLVRGQVLAEDTPPAIAADGRVKAAYLGGEPLGRSEEHTSELQSLMRISYAVFCLKKKNRTE